MNKNVKFAAGIAVIVTAIVYLAVSGFNSDISYYRTVEEVLAMGEDMQGKNLQVAGLVLSGTIDRTQKDMRFTIHQNEKTIPVVYVSEKPVPDTFKDGVETVVRGKFNDSGEFEAEHIQAKCASKYEAKLEEASVVRK